jgi:hypothetical protein
MLELNQWADVNSKRKLLQQQRWSEYQHNLTLLAHFLCFFRRERDYIHLNKAMFVHLTFMGPCIANIFQYISNKMQLNTVYLHLETALHVSGVTSTHHQERIQLYLQHLVYISQLLLPAAIAAGDSNGLINIRCCRYSCMRSWWWVKVTPEMCRAVPGINKLCKVASCWIYIAIYCLYHYI